MDAALWVIEFIFLIIIWRIIPSFHDVFGIKREMQLMIRCGGINLLLYIVWSVKVMLYGYHLWSFMIVNLIFGVLIGMALGLVLMLSWQTIYLSIVAVFLAALYPFMKRYTQLPQVFLGAAFSWGIIMAFAEAQGEIPLVAWLLFSANLCWTIAYDTMYAMVDRDDDIKIGVKSSAILFAKNDKRVIGFLQLITLALLWTVGDILAFGWPYQLSLVIAAGLFSYQQVLIVNRNREACFQAFLHNHWVGLIVFVGISIEYL